MRLATIRTGGATSAVRVDASGAVETDDASDVAFAGVLGVVDTLFDFDGL
jgi:hypothetical protein